MDTLIMSASDLNRFCFALSEARSSLGLSMDDAARLSGITMERLSDWERGKELPPSKDLLRYMLAVGIDFYRFIQLRNITELVPFEKEI